MRIVMVAGSCPPEPGGVGGYTFRLVEALKNAGCEVQVFTGRKFGLANVFGQAREIRAAKPGLVHIHYHTTGYGTRLRPQVLSSCWRPAW